MAFNRYRIPRHRWTKTSFWNSDESRSVLEEYLKFDPQAKFTVRLLTLNGKRDNIIRDWAVEGFPSFVQQMKGTPFPAPVNFGLKYVWGKLGFVLTKYPFFCSDLLAQTYLRLDIFSLKDTAASSSYTPADFSSDRISLPFGRLCIFRAVPIGPGISSQNIYLECLLCYT